LKKDIPSFGLSGKTGLRPLEWLSRPPVNDPIDFQAGMKEKRKGARPSPSCLDFKPVFCFEETFRRIDVDDQMMGLNIEVKIGEESQGLSLRPKERRQKE
jgi:hypothetical protein